MKTKYPNFWIGKDQAIDNPGWTAAFTDQKKNREDITGLVLYVPAPNIMELLEKHKQHEMNYLPFLAALETLISGEEK